MSNVRECKWLLVKYYYTLEKTTQEFRERIYVRMRQFAQVPEMNVRMLRGHDITYVFVSFEPSLVHLNIEELFTMKCYDEERLKVKTYPNATEFVKAVVKTYSKRGIVEDKSKPIESEKVVDLIDQYAELKYKYDLLLEAYKELNTMVDKFRELNLKLLCLNSDS